MTEASTLKVPATQQTSTASENFSGAHDFTIQEAILNDYSQVNNVYNFNSQPNNSDPIANAGQKARAKRGTLYPWASMVIVANLNPVQLFASLKRNKYLVLGSIPPSEYHPRGVILKLVKN
jgi:hypothetical protein